MILLRIVSPYFVCGVVVRLGLVTRAAPIVKYMVGWDYKKVTAYCQKKHWSIEEVV